MLILFITHKSLNSFLLFFGHHSLSHLFPIWTTTNIDPKKTKQKKNKRKQS